MNSRMRLAGYTNCIVEHKLPLPKMPLFSELPSQKYGNSTAYIVRTMLVAIFCRNRRVLVRVLVYSWAFGSRLHP